MLASIPLSADLGPVALDAVARHAIERHARRGEALSRAGDAAAGIYVVLDGAVRVVRELRALRERGIVDPVRLRSLAARHR